MGTTYSRMGDFLFFATMWCLSTIFDAGANISTLSQRLPCSAASIFGSDTPKMEERWQLVTRYYSKGL